MIDVASTVHNSGLDMRLLPLVFAAFSIQFLAGNVLAQYVAQCLQFRPRLAVVPDDAAARRLRDGLAADVAEFFVPS